MDQVKEEIACSKLVAAIFADVLFCLINLVHVVLYYYLYAAICLIITMS